MRFFVLLIIADLLCEATQTNKQTNMTVTCTVTLSLELFTAATCFSLDLHSVVNKKYFLKQ